MSQSKLASLVEVVANMALGFIVSVYAQVVIFPLYGFTTLSLKENVQIVAIFTVISMVRGYLVRRFFNWLMARKDGENVSG
jgi:hypothetical protein